MIDRSQVIVRKLPMGSGTAAMSCVSISFLALADTHDIMIDEIIQRVLFCRAMPRGRSEYASDSILKTVLQ
jgi:hypothetical protein